MPQELRLAGGHRLAGVQYSDATATTPLVALLAVAMSVRTLCGVCAQPSRASAGTPLRNRMFTWTTYESSFVSSKLRGHGRRRHDRRPVYRPAAAGRGHRVLQGGRDDLRRGRPR